jgi:hypothetical protein
MRKIVISILLVGWAGAAEAKREIRISTVDQLYAAVYNEANANTRLVLAPGVYPLSAVGHPRGGALLLQEGMEIAGGNVYADADGDGVWDAEFDGNPVIAGRRGSTAAAWSVLRRRRGHRCIGNTGERRARGRDRAPLREGGIAQRGRRCGARRRPGPDRRDRPERGDRRSHRADALRGLRGPKRTLIFYATP